MIMKNHLTFDALGAQKTQLVASADPSSLRLQKIYTTPNNKAAFDSRQALIKAAPKGTTCKKIDKFLSQSETYTKFRASRNKFSRLKVQSLRINEIWSGYLADMYQLARQNDGTKFLLVFVDCLSRFLRVEPIESKSASHTKTALQKMLKRKNCRKKIWVDKGKEFKGDFARFRAEKNIFVYSTHKEMKSCFAERYIRTLKSISFKFPHENNTSRYIDHLQSFVSLINSRPNRTTKIAPKSVTIHDVPYLVSLSQLQTLFAKPATKLVTLFEYDYASQRSTKATKSNTPKKFSKL